MQKTKAPAKIKAPAKATSKPRKIPIIKERIVNAKEINGIHIRFSFGPNPGNIDIDLSVSK